MRDRNNFQPGQKIERDVSEAIVRLTIKVRLDGAQFIPVSSGQDGADSDAEASFFSFNHLPASFAA